MQEVENDKKTRHSHSSSSQNLQKIDYGVLLYVPNIIGYIRLFFLVFAFLSLSYSPALFITFYSVSIILDGFDGYAARKLQQCSLYGAWFDVVLDNVSRGLLWTHIHPMLYMVSAVEWIAFVCNHSIGAEWRERLKHGLYKEPPKIVTYTMDNNFRNAWGVWSIAGLHVLPVWLMGLQYDVFSSHLWFIPYFVQIGGLVVLTLGRLLCFFIELWSIWMHMTALLVNISVKV